MFYEEQSEPTEAKETLGIQIQKTDPSEPLKPQPQPLRSKTLTNFNKSLLKRFSTLVKKD